MNVAICYNCSTWDMDIAKRAVRMATNGVEDQIKKIVLLLPKPVFSVPSSKTLLKHLRESNNTLENVIILDNVDRECDIELNIGCYVDVAAGAYQNTKPYLKARRYIQLVNKTQDEEEFDWSNE